MFPVANQPSTYHKHSRPSNKCFSEHSAPFLWRALLKLFSGC
uniref:Uncharacterized protein n=1 Tax=Proteus mirabilis TaxID=584 RepID=A0A1L5JMZ5_PROMI|nr:hypothetical protein [Proteus mirabilis]APO16934.1 hypothetical protein [Proteus mirabilis]APO17018.1 hypothetical protein [Proteus mirabilis]